MGAGGGGGRSRGEKSSVAQMKNVSDVEKNNDRIGTFSTY